ncbi:MAG: cysteine desulfurase-like protein [Gemmatimonadota bacterium]|nr:cysteine desulfurase-like protein [Gemmatimonadota bacterium]
MFDAAFAERLRADFPALERHFGGRPLAFLDGPAGSQVPRSVIQAIGDYLTFHNANGGGCFPTSLETEETLTAGRTAMADFVGGDPGEIVFGQNMTTLTFALSRSLAHLWREGDEVIVTQLDHQANVAPWRMAARERGVTVRVLPFDPDTGRLEMEALDGLLSPRTRLVAVGHASNALGTLNDVRRVVESARTVGALTFVDAVHSAPHIPIDVGEIGCDFLACSAYKFFGPHVGILWSRREHLDEFPPYRVPPAPDTAPERWETGTMNHEGIAGVAAAVDWIAGLAPDPTVNRRQALLAAMARVEASEQALFAEMIEGLQAIPGLRIYGPGAREPRTPTVGLTLDGVPAGRLAARLAEEGVCVWAGDFYASTVVDNLGIREQGGLLRAGLAPYSTREDVERLVGGIWAASGRG